MTRGLFVCRVVLCMHFLVLNKRWSFTRGVSQRRDHCYNYYVIMEQLLLNLKPKILHIDLQLKLYPNNKHKLNLILILFLVLQRFVKYTQGAVDFDIAIRAKKWSTKKLI